ncbi:MAG: hypothetical protein R6V34_02195 [Bacteroidales bacterium]
MGRRSRHIQYIIRAVVILLLIIFADQVFNKVVYLHTHVLDSGNVLTHAHPFDKGVDTEPVKRHQHTWEQIMFLDNIQFLFLVFFSVLSLLIYGSEKRRFNNNASLYPATCLHTNYGRAPPVL